MNRKAKKLFVVLLAMVMTFGILPTSVFAEGEDDRIVITAVEATHDVSGYTTYGSTSHPGFEIRGSDVTVGQPAHLTMCDVEIWNGSKWSDAPDGALQEGTYRLNGQLRIDGTAGSAYVLSNATTVEINGQAWSPSASNTSVYKTYSFRWFYGPSFTITKPAGLPLSVPGEPISYSDDLYTDTAMTSFSVTGYVTGGEDPISYAKKSGPSWISVSNDGTISGTPNAIGENAPVIITVTDSAEDPDSKEITVNLPETNINPADREVISAVEITHDLSSVVYGSTSYPSTDETIISETTVGQPAHLSMLSLMKHNGSSWVDVPSGALGEGTYRYEAQLRTDGSGGRTHVIGASTTLSVNGETWSSNDATASVFPKYSFRWYYSPSFEITENTHTHTGGTATCEDKAVCTICSQPYGDYVEHTYNNDCDTTCNVCEATRSITHSFTVDRHDSTQHWKECSVCGAADTKTNHSGGTATCEDKAVCDGCGQAYGDYADHTYDNACDDACNVCGDTRTPSAHVYDNACDATCNECGDTRTPSAHVYDNACDANCNVCNATRSITHNFTIDRHDSTQHWKECSVCGAADTKTNHSGGTATCEDKAVCDGCGQAYGDYADHTYDNACDDACNVCGDTRTPSAHVYDNTCDTNCNVCNATRSITHSFTVDRHDNTQHWKECSVCGAADTKADHEYGAGDVCDICGYDSGHTHSFTVDNHDNTQHWKECSICGASDTKTNHSGGTATCENKAVCDGCGQPYGDYAEHTYDNACDAACNVCGDTRTPSAHAYDNACDDTCNVCGDTRTPSAHVYDNACDATCDVCNATRSITHNANPVAEVPATAETTGSEAHYECTVCGALFEDAACANPTTEADLVIAKLAPTLLEGNNGSYTKGSSTGLTFKSSAALSDLKNVSVDGSVIDEAKYEKASGSTVITLKPSYLDTLAVGAHSLVIESVTGSVDADFTIGEAEVIPSDEETPEDELLEEETSEDDSPKTGDSSNVILWAGMLLVTSAAMLVTTRRRKKSNR